MEFIKITLIQLKHSRNIGYRYNFSPNIQYVFEEYCHANVLLVLIQI